MIPDAAARPGAVADDGGGAVGPSCRDQSNPSDPSPEPFPGGAGMDKGYRTRLTTRDGRTCVST